jgi:pseudo-rSAM protein
MSKKITSKKSTTDYWFVIDPYVYIRVNDNYALLYNTLDGVSLESDNVEIKKLLREILEKENCGVMLLQSETYKKNEIKYFIRELRKKYMGDIIDVNLSEGKPVQIMPFFNYPNNHEIYKQHSFTPIKNIFDNLTDINIHADATTNTQQLISFLKSIPGTPTFNIIGTIWDVPDYCDIMSFLNQHPSYKKLQCSYSKIKPLQEALEKSFSYKITVNFPIDMQQWNNSRKVLLNQALQFEYIFKITSEEDCQEAEKLIDQFHIEKYQLQPKYTGNNIRFFEEKVFLTKEDILSSSLSIKDFFIHQSINSHDFGKINIMPNGDAYANINHPTLGNIYMHSFVKIIQNEIDKGKSWFRIRNQAPCNDCVYQWLCPSPSNYEIDIGRPNLCHVEQL